MAWLNALLAFTLAMIIFCTIVSAITETIQHFFQLRRRGLEEMLGKLFDEVIGPRVTSMTRKDWVEQLIRNLGVPSGGIRWNWLLPTKLDALTTTEFIRRVAESDVGKQILDMGAAESDRFVNALAVRFERSGNDARDYFGRRARTFSVLIALVLALVLNIDAFRLFSSFLTDKELTNRILAQQDAITAPLRRPPVSAEAATGTTTGADATGSLTPGPTATETAPSATPETPAVPSEPAPPDDPGNPSSQASGGASVDQLRSRARAVMQMIQQSSAMGLPIGANYFPYCADPATSPDRLCRQTEPAPWYYVGWLLSTLLAGFLIGLGGPFWYNAFSHLSGIVELARSAMGKGKSGAGAPTEEAPPPPPSTPAEVFRAALNVAPRVVRPSRLPLSPQGTPDLRG